MAWRAASVGVAALLLLGAALLNGGPILYPDSVAYFIDGDRIAHATAPYAVRPVFYGIPLWLLYRGAGFWAALFAQAMVVAHLLGLTLRATGTGRLLPVTLGLVLLTPVTWHVAHLLPDVFLAVLVLALFLLGFCADRLGPIERGYLVCLAAAATSFHLTAFPLAAALAAGTAAWWWFDRRLARPGLVVLPLILALAGSLGFNALVWHRITLAPNSPPALLARLLADGPARDFLRARCPDTRSNASFELCRYLDRLPATEDGFLWEMLPALPVPDGKAIKEQAGAVIGGTVRMFPGAVLEHMLANAARQAVMFRSETQLTPEQRAALERDGEPLALATKDTLQARGELEAPRLDAINTVHAAVAAASLLAALVLLIRRPPPRVAALLAAVLLALLVNAGVTGAFGGVFARYEGRVIWLLPLAVAVAWLSAAPPMPSRPRTIARTGSTPR